MKKIFTMILVGAAAVLASVSCNKEEVIEASKDGTVRFYANEIKTKTEFGTPDGNKYPTLWTTAEGVKISLNGATGIDYSVTPSVDRKSADLNPSDPSKEITDDGTHSYKFYALSPNSAYVSVNASQFNVNFPANQTPKDGSVDEKAQILFASFDANTTFPATVNLSFEHLAAYGKLSFSNLALDGDETVSSITIESPEDWTGRWQYVFSSGEYNANSSSNILTLTTDKTTDIWFACKPVNLEGQTISISIATNKGTFSKNVAFKSGTGNFVAGKIGSFIVDMDGITRVAPVVYTMVDDIADLTLGSEVIIVGKDDDAPYAISTTQNGNNRAIASITKSTSAGGDAIINDPGADVQVFTIKNGSTAGTYAFDTGEGYIYAASSSSNYMRTEASLSLNSSWTISIAGDGEATISANGSNTRNTIRCNKGNNPPIFSCYASGSTTGSAVVIYKKNGTGAAVLPKVTIAGDIEAEVSGKNIIVTWTDPADANVSKYKVTCTGQADQDVTPSEEGYIFENLADGEYVITVTAIAANSSTHRNSNTWTSSELEISSITFEEIDLTAKGYANQEDVTTVSGSVAKLVFAKGSGSNAPKYYTSGTSVRTYAKNTLTVSVSTGKKISKIEFTLGGTKSATVTVDSGTLGDISGSSRTWTAGATKPDSVVFTNGSSNQMHYQKVKVYYE